MIQLDFEKKGPWYMGVEFQDSHLVTNKNYNRELGIGSILLRPANSEESGIVAGVLIRMVNGVEIEGSIYEAKGGTEMNFNTKQKKLSRADGSPYWIPVDVKIPMAISAQVLCYAETKRKEVAVIPASTQLASPAPVQQVPARQAFTPEQIEMYIQSQKK